MVLSVFTETIRPIIMILGGKNHQKTPQKTKPKQSKPLLIIYRILIWNAQSFHNLQEGCYEWMYLYFLLIECKVLSSFSVFTFKTTVHGTFPKWHKM